MDDQSVSEPPSPVGAKATSKGRKWAVYFVKLGIGVAIVAFLLVKFDARKVVQAMTQMNLRTVFWTWFWMLLGLWCHSVMLQRALLLVGIRFRTRDIYKINFQIRFYGLFMPGATNVLVKWHKLAKPTGKPAESLAVMAFTRMLHLFAMLILTVWGMLMDSAFPWNRMRILAACLLLFVVLGIALTTSKTTGAYMDYGAGSILRILPENGLIRKRLQKLWGFFTNFRRLSLMGLLILMGLSVVGQVFMAFSQINIAHGVGMDISLATQFWIRGVILICAVIPMSFSGLGIREASIVGLMVFYGIPEQTALAYSLAFFGLTVGLGLVGGVLEAYEHFFPAKRPAGRKEVS